MKRVLIVLALVSTIAVVSFAQKGNTTENEPAPKMAISVNPFALVVCMVEGSYEIRMGKMFALKADIAWSPNFAWVTRVTIWGMRVGARFYLMDFGYRFSNFKFAINSNGLRGLYASAGAGFYSYYYDYNYPSVISVVCPSFFIEVGYKYMFSKESKGFFVEPYLGFEYVIGSSAIFGPMNGNGGFRWGLNLGFAF